MSLIRKITDCITLILHIIHLRACQLKNKALNQKTKCAQSFGIISHTNNMLRQGLKSKDYC